MAKKRFSETVNLQPVDVRSGQTEGLRSLSERLDDFEHMGAQMAQHGFQRRAEEKAQLGIERAGEVELRGPGGDLLQPQFEEPGLFNQHEVKAYNATLADAYKASLDNDNREALGRIYVDNKSDLLSYNDAAKGYTKGVVGNVDPSMRAEVAADLEREVSIGRTKVYANQIAASTKKAKIEIQAQYDGNANAAAREARLGNKLASGEYLLKAKETLDKLWKSGAISEARAEKIKGDVDREVTEQTIRYDLDQLSTAETKTKIDSMEDEVAKGWSPDEWDKFIKSARSDLKYKQVIEKAAAREAGELVQQELLTKIVDKTCTEADIINAEFTNEDDRVQMLRLLHSTSDRATSAARAEKIDERRDRDDLFKMETRLQGKIDTREKEVLFSSYNNRLLSEEFIDRSPASQEIKAKYHKMLDAQEKDDKKRRLAATKLEAEAIIINNLGKWTDAQIRAFMPSLPPDEVYQWQQRNRQIQNDPNDYRNKTVYRKGLEDLSNSKKNLLFIGGSSNRGATPRQQFYNDSINTEQYMDTLREYVERCAEEGADPREVLKELKTPYIDKIPKTFMEKVKGVFFNQDARDQAAKEKLPKTKALKSEPQKPKTPTLEEFLEAASKRPKNKNYTEQQLTDFYNNTYGEK